MFRLPAKLLAQNGILRSNADRAGVEVAFAHHDAAHRDQWCGRESELLCAEECGDDDIAPGLQFAVSLNADTAA